jgi:hypothetical protein
VYPVGEHASTLVAGSKARAAPYTHGQTSAYQRALTLCYLTSSHSAIIPSLRALSLRGVGQPVAGSGTDTARSSW